MVRLMCACWEGVSTTRVGTKPNSRQKVYFLTAQLAEIRLPDSKKTFRPRTDVLLVLTLSSPDTQTTFPTFHRAPLSRFPTQPLVRITHTMSEAPRKPDILCIGFGALGTIYSYLLSRGGASITAVARSNYDTLTTTGIHISSIKYGEIEGWKPDRCVRESEPHTARDRVYDFVVCTFKNVPDHKSASSIIRPFLKEGGRPTVVLLQNGVGIEEEVMRTLVEGEGLASGVVSGVAWIGANLVDGGKRVMHGGLERLEMGCYPSTTAPLLEDGRRQVSSSEQAALDEFARIYLAGGGGGRVVDDIDAIRWQKILWNASWGGLSTLARQPVSALLTSSTLHYSIGVVRRIMLEIVYVARASGISESRFPFASVDNAINITLTTSP